MITRPVTIPVAHVVVFLLFFLRLSSLVSRVHTGAWLTHPALPVRISPHRSYFPRPRPCPFSHIYCCVLRVFRSTMADLRDELEYGNFDIGFAKGVFPFSFSFLTHMLAPNCPARTVTCALPGARAYWMRIGTCNPMSCNPIHVFRPEKEQTNAASHRELHRGVHKQGPFTLRYTKYGTRTPYPLLLSSGTQHGRAPMLCYGTVPSPWPSWSRHYPSLSMPQCRRVVVNVRLLNKVGPRAIMRAVCAVDVFSISRSSVSPSIRLSPLVPLNCRSRLCSLIRRRASLTRLRRSTTPTPPPRSYGFRKYLDVLFTRNPCI